MLQWYILSAASCNVVKRRGNEFGVLGAVWTEPYIDVITGSLSLTAARQLRTPLGALAGVVAADFDMSSVDLALKMLVDAEDSGSMLTFIVDSQGFMISSSISDLSL